MKRFLKNSFVGLGFAAMIFSPLFNNDRISYAAESTGNSFDTAKMLELGHSVNAMIDEDGECLYYVIKPTESGNYFLYSSGNEDTICTLYEDVDSDIEEVESDDDSGEGYNFKLSYYFEKGKTYYCEIGMYEGTGSFSVASVAMTGEDIIDYGSCGDNLNYTLTGDGVLTISGSGEMDDWGIISSDVQPWHYNMKMIKKIVIKSGVMSIGQYAFPNCTNLTSIEIPDSVEEIHGRAFVGCSKLRNVTIPNGVECIEYDVFGGCSSLTSITIPNSVTIIEDAAFYGCSSLTNITIPNSVTSIGYEAFEDCSSLTNIKIPNSVTSIGYKAFEDCSSLTNIKIPNSVTRIEPRAFMYCSSLTSVTIPNSVTSIKYEAFEGCRSLTDVQIPSSVTEIDSNAFYGCIGLSSIKVDNNNKVYDSRDNCNAVIETKTNKLLIGCKNTIIPSSVTSIGYESFCRCSGLTSIKIPNGVKKIESSSFMNCSNLKSITIPDSVISIGAQAFVGCTSLTSVNLPNSITSIYAETFRGCSSLINIIIPESVTVIYKYAFADCKNLNKVYILNKNAEVSKFAGYGENWTDFSSATLVGFKGSTTEAYAKEKGYNFEEIAPKTTIGTPVIATDGITVKWSKNTTATGYYIYRSVNGAAYTKVKTITSNATVSWKDTTAKTNGNKYQYKIVAYKTINGKNYTGSASSIKTIYFLTRPTVTLANTSTGVKIGWGKNSKTTGYYVYKSTDGGKTYKKVKTITSNATVSYTDTAAKTNGTKYMYKVEAYKTVSGTTYKSATSSVKTIYFLTRPTVTLANQASAIKVSWGKNAKATGYYVYKSTDGGKTYKKIKTVTSNATVSYTDTAAKTNGTKYMYKVEAYKTVSGTTYKSAVSAIKTMYFVSKPAISSATNSAAGKMLIKWARNAKASGYQIQYSTSSSFTSPKTVTATGTSSTLSKTIGSLTKGKTYYVRIRSYKTVGSTKFYSAWSASKSVKITK